MRIRTFSAPTMTEAMTQIRQALGDDAVIISSHQSERGRGVQVTAAADPDANGAEGDGIITDEEALLENGNGDALSGLPDDDILLQSLLYHDVPVLLAERLAAIGARSQAVEPVEALAAGLNRYFEFQSLTDIARPIMLIGPAGAGKTVTLAKLATAAALRGDPTTVITTDTVRAGATAQLSGYTDILQQPLLTVETPENLHAAILNHAGSRILIDTPSANPFNADEMSDLGRFIAVADVDPVLVVPAGLNAQDAGDMAAVFARLGCNTFIATQLDGARRLGAILAAAHGGSLAFSGVSITSSIANGLTSLSPMSLARVLLRDPEENHQYAQSGVNQA